MSYCVNCGVELDSTSARCPLCFTPVLNPIELVDTVSPTPFPTRETQVPPVSQKEMALLLTTMLASVAVCCGLLNLLLRPDRLWSMYAVGATIMLWVWLVPPLLSRAMPNWIKLTLDVIAVGVYVYLISVELHGGDWFWGLAMPVILSAAAVVLVVSLLLRGHRRSILSTIVTLLCALGFYVLTVEFFADRFLEQVWRPGWSLVVFTVSISLSIPLVIVRWVPSLRAEARRKFHL